MTERFCYFGCVGSAGHFTHEGGRRTYKHDSPWGTAIDTTLCPSGPEVEGRAALHHKDGWTALAFWDRSVDKRGKSNSVFLSNQARTFDEMLAQARIHFPDVMSRFKFEIVLTSGSP
jgi:hypothetical protein